MLDLDKLLAELKYNESPHYRDSKSKLEPETAHLFRAAFDKEVGVSGIYVFETSTGAQDKVLPAQPAVYIADVQIEDEAKAKAEAKRIHRSLWNLCYAPYIIVRLPHQIRIYTGFNYDEKSDVGLLDVKPTDTPEHLEKLREILVNFNADEIDSGRIWQSRYAKELNSNQRVDEHLLENLRKLGSVLKDYGLRNEVAHALIGKYVFLSYLRERDILSEVWLTEKGIEPESVFSFRATKSSLFNLLKALKDFNGKIFPIDFNEPTLDDKHVSWVASVIAKGDKPVSNAPDKVIQLHLPFKAYDFRFIPVETLSVIYEQFIADEDKKTRQKKGAIYTPEFLADYLLSEVNSVKPLKKGMKILDPACGSGIFLVLAYRRLIEQEMEQRGGKSLNPAELGDILVESIYGVERIQDACYVTEFSLILTLLHYAEPRQLQNLQFALPDLHNNRIFESDFFDLNGESSKAKFWQQDFKFDWIIGNPPWIELDPKTKDEDYARTWIEENKSQRPTSGNRVAEAFSWLVTDLLNSDGLVGLLLPATSLFNLESKEYRKPFFTQHEVYRITNFANFRDVLFGKKNSGVLPAMTIIYRPAVEGRAKSDIIHYAPFVINQQAVKAKDKPWIITINESEVKTISSDEAEEGETFLWKLALWGTHRDKRAIERLRYLFPVTLADFCERRGWGADLPRQGAELKENSEDSSDKLEYLPELTNLKQFSTNIYNKQKPRFRFSIPKGVLIDNNKFYLRIRGGKTGLFINSAPHIILSKAWQNFAIYSNDDFIIPPQQIAISASSRSVENEDCLRALTVYLSSSLVAYYVFFQVPEWGVFRQRKSVVTSEIRKIPTPDFTLEQAIELANLHRELVKEEKQTIFRLINELHKNEQRTLDIFDDTDYPETNILGLPSNLSKADKQKFEEAIAKLQENLQAKIDDKVFDLFNIPAGIRLLVEDFVQTRLPLDKPTTIENLTNQPGISNLLAYAQTLRDALDSFAMGLSHHRVIITYSNELIECMIEMTKESRPLPISENNIRAGDVTIAKLLAELSVELSQQFSQWIYVQRGLRLFDGPRIYIYKSPRVIDWTRSQALNDANDIIGSSLSKS